MALTFNINNPVTKEKIGEVINGAASGTPNDTDLVMSVDTSVAKKNTWTQVKAFLKTYFDTVYQATGSYLTSANITQTITNGVTTNAPSEDAVFDALALKASSSDVRLNNYIQLACSDETTALTTGTAKITFRMPYGFTLTAVRASLTTAQTSGNIFTVDINESGSSILSTKITIDNTEKTSVTAATPVVISDTTLADDAEITIDIDQIGDGTAKGLKVTLIGYNT